MMTMYITKAVTKGGGCFGCSNTPKLFAIFLVSQLCLFVQQNIFRLRLLNIGVYLNYHKCTKTHHFEIKMQKFSGEEDTPRKFLHFLFQNGEFLCICDKLNVTPPKKILVTALYITLFCIAVSL